MQLIVYYSGVGATYLVDLPDGAANTVQDVLSMLLQQFNVAAPLGSPTVAGSAGSASPTAGEPPSELALKFGACHCCGAWRCNASCLLCGTHGWASTRRRCHAHVLLCMRGMVCADNRVLPASAKLSECGVAHLSTLHLVSRGDTYVGQACTPGDACSQLSHPHACLLLPAHRKNDRTSCRKRSCLVRWS